MKFLLDFHYSDFWTDLGRQNKPKAWRTMSVEQLADAVYAHTKEHGCPGKGRCDA